MGREQQNPAVLISGCTQLAKLLGYYEPEVMQVGLMPETANLRAKFAGMTDEQLVALAGRSTSQEH